ncbi:MAG: class I SAM-dependent methyltransferase [Ruminococcus sp.]|uniref:class I SAM-dependent methyltransferase n=1 Tax=Ruminococcus sp. TaxID=41978 RepID=UPI0025E63D4B|nr:class I SAM-dependent methyltransferase [Ruminococcus sp.]MBR6995556.1 class I SAM-dependent methyltransferase [Ruminococcus sp.]
MELKLGDVQETALIPLAIKADESKRSDHRIYDAKAVEIIDGLGIDTKKYDKYMSHEGVVARTILFDNEVKKLLEKYPDAVCVNIGCGFDDRFSRVDNGSVRWYNVDLPDSIELRKKVFSDRDREFMKAGDLTDTEWTVGIPNEGVTIIIAEGLLMYFSEEQVSALLDHICTYFGKGYILAEIMHPFAVKNSSHHDTVKNTKASFGWGIESGREAESLCSGISFVKEINFFEEIKKYSLIGKIGSKLFNKVMDRLAVYRFER